MKIVTSQQMREIEMRSEQAGVSTDALMETAGLQVARRVRDHVGHVGHLAGVPISILVGPGNNGGDGLVTARHLHAWGARVTVYLCLDRRTPDPKLELVRERDITVVHGAEDDGLAKLRELLASSDVVVDSILGTGRARPIEGALREVLRVLRSSKGQRSDLRIVAMDLPTGLDSDTGGVDPACVPADVTATLGYPKVGLFTLPGADIVGTLEVEDIGIPPNLDGDIGLELMTPAWAAPTLPQRPSGAHKGTFGRTLVVAGSRNYVGAAYLAAAAATRVGAGLVAIALPESLQAAVASKAAEPIYVPLPEASPGVIAAEAASTILDHMADYDAMLLGCGLGQAAPTAEFVERVLYSGEAMPPTVVDADGLNILSRSQDPGWWTRFAARAIVTPHPGEMARLMGEQDGPAQQERIGKTSQAAASWNKVTVLKGAHTVVAAPDGGAMLSPFANPGLASAGTGDVLAGTIAGLLSQGLSIEDAAALGVFLHGQAGERVRQELGDTGMIASDLLGELPKAIKELRETSPASKSV